MQDSCAQYWPSEGSSQFGEFTVNLVDKEGTPGFVMRKFIVESSKVFVYAISRLLFIEYCKHNKIHCFIHTVISYCRPTK